MQHLCGRRKEYQNIVRKPQRRKYPSPIILRRNNIKTSVNLMKTSNLKTWIDPTP
jgi:hypothetical protein